VLEWLENTQFSALVRTELWGWPLALTLHALGTALVLGFVLIIGLRLLGLFRLVPFAALAHLFPIVWAGLVLQIFSGFTLWMSKPTQYVADVAFVSKMLLFVAGVALLHRFQAAIRRDADAWDAARAASSPLTGLVAATLLVWCGVLVTGRLTAYLGSI
jgi:hypothetical protein